MSKDKKPYHELPDIAPKLLRILVQAEVLPPSAHQVYFTICDRFNSKGERERECFEGSSGNGRRAGLSKKQFNRIANCLVELGLLRLDYRVWMNNADNDYKDFSIYEEAQNFLAECKQRTTWVKHPELMRLYTPVERVPTPEELGLTLVNPKNHIYSAPMKIRRTGKKRPGAIEENVDSSLINSDSHTPQKSGLNGTNNNHTNSNETNPMASTTLVGVEEIAKTSPAGSLSISTPPPSGNFSILITEFEKKFEKEFGRKVPRQQLKAVLSDKSILDGIEQNIVTVMEAAGNLTGWVDCEFDRMRRNVGKGTYRSPKIEFFGNTKSLNEYLDQLHGQIVLRKINPFSDYLSMEELRQCLTQPAEGDLLLMRHLTLMEAYANFDSRSEMYDAVNLPSSYLPFFEIHPKSFLYIGFKYFSQTGRHSERTLQIARKFAK